jgi:uncharacterized protein (DUF58 family)
MHAAETEHRSSGRSRSALSEPIQRRYDFGWSTAIFIMTTVFLAIGAINSQNNLLFWAFGLAVGGLVVSGFVSGAGLMGLRLERVAPELARVGEPADVRYRVRSLSRLTPAFGLIIRERAHIQDAGGSIPLTFETGVQHVGAGASATATAPWKPDTRGVVRFESVDVTTTAPFGLLRKTLRFRIPASLPVGPRRIALRLPGVRSSERSPSPALPPRATVGQGDEFFGLRPYTPGDSPRFIAWRPSARRGELLIRQMTPPASPRCQIVLVRWPTDTDRHLVERAVALAAAAYEAAVAGGYSVALDAPWAGVHVPSAEQSTSLSRVLRALAELSPVTDGDDKAIPSHPHHRSVATIVVVANSSDADRADHDHIVLAADDPHAWSSGGPLGPELRRATTDRATRRMISRLIRRVPRRKAGAAVGITG